MVMNKITELKNEGYNQTVMLGGDLKMIGFMNMKSLYVASINTFKFLIE